MLTTLVSEPCRLRSVVSLSLTSSREQLSSVFALGRLSLTSTLSSILPLLLSSFGDAINDVRDATQDASRVIMSRLSGHCVNIVLPSLLAGLEEKQWRTKKGSIELLGSMAFCAPRQLALSLPTIIPELTAVLTDSQ